MFTGALRKPRMLNPQVSQFDENMYTPFSALTVGVVGGQ